MRPTTARRKLRRALVGAIALAATATVALVIPAIVSPVNAALVPTVIKTSDFEDGTVQGWARRGTVETVANSTTVAHGGTHSLSITGRTASWNGPQLDLLGVMQKGTRYTFSIWVQLASGSPTTPMRLSVERRLNGTATYETVVNNVNANAGSWVQLTGGYTLGNDVDFLTVYVESASGTPSFFIDDFSMSYITPLPIQTGLPAVKDALASWFPNIGAAVSTPQLIGDRATLLKKHFNSVTPGNAMKWDATEPTAGTFVYTDADAIVTFATANNIKVRGHTLVWHNQTPSWVFQDATGATMTPTAANKTLLLSRLQAHVNAVVGHYKSKLYAWDVVNEVLNEDGTLRNSMWYQIAGLDYIRNAFTWARAADPSSTLCINDYNLTVAAKRDGMYNLVNQLKSEGIPIDCIGSQMHSNINWPTGADTGAMLDKFGTLNVTQQITELDVSVYTDNTSSYPEITEAMLQTQATRYNAIFAQFKSHASMISSITWWGLTDDDSWLNSYPISRLDAPLLFDVQFQAKPAFYIVTGASSTSPSSSASPTRSPSASPSASRSASASPSASRSASASTSATTGTASCRVVYAIVGSWPGGFQGEVKVTNTGTAAINGWTLRWAFANGQTITQLWSGSVTQSGGAVTVTNASYNGPIGAGATANFGFLASWTGTNAVPTAFTLNNSACALG